MRVLFLFILIVCKISYSQSRIQFIISGNHLKVDSIIKVALESKDIQQRVETNNVLGAYYESISNYPKAFYYLDQAQKQNTNNYNERIYTYNYFGYVFWHKSEYDSSLLYHNRALELAKNKKIRNVISFMLWLGCKGVQFELKT